MISYREGNLLEEIKAHAIIAHTCPNNTNYNHSFAYKVGLKYPEARKVFITKYYYDLGEIQAIKVTPNLIIVNMVSLQFHNDTYSPSYAHLQICLDSLRQFAMMMDKPIHIPQLSPKEDVIVISKLADCTIWTNKNTSIPNAISTAKLQSERPFN